MIIKKTTSNGVDVYYVDKNISDDDMDALKNTYVKKSQIKDIIRDDADVFTVDGTLLLRYRKNKLDPKYIEEFYDNTIDFAKRETTNRGGTSGQMGKKNVADNPKIMTNIFGFFDRFSPRQKYTHKKKGHPIKLEARECKFNMDNPDKYQKTLPLIRQIDEFYKKLIPDKYTRQRKKADQTHFKIIGTCFTTVTTNVNFQTTMHKDKGDDPDGFGNLTVIEHGKYTGGETCFPQYGVGVDARMGDVLFMNVHEWHGNLPIKKKNKDAIRMSIVCYLRYNLWEKTKHKSKKFMINHNKTIKAMRES